MSDPEPLVIEATYNHDGTIKRYVWPDPLPRHVHVVTDEPPVHQALKHRGYKIAHVDHDEGVVGYSLRGRGVASNPMA